MTPIDDYRNMLQEEGFTRLLQIPFLGSDKVSQESFEIWWHSEDALLLRFDTFCARHINSAAVYYNWRAAGAKGWDFTSSGALYGNTWVGSHDAREHLSSKLGNLRAHGVFVNPWDKQPFLYLRHYGDDRDATFQEGQATDAARIALLPPEVQAAIAGEAK